MSLQLCPGCKKWQETPYLHSQPSNFCENCRKRQRPNEVDGFKQSSVVSDDPLGAFSKKHVISDGPQDPFGEHDDLDIMDEEDPQCVCGHPYTMHGGTDSIHPGSDELDGCCTNDFYEFGARVWKRGPGGCDCPEFRMKRQARIVESLAPNPNQQMMTYSCDDCNEPVKDTLFMNMFDSSQRCMACAQKDASGMLHVPIPVPVQTVAPKKPPKKAGMTRCLFCGSKYDDWEAEDSFCPDCGSDQSKEPRYVQADPETGEPIAAQHPPHPQDMSVGEDPGHDYQR